MVRKMFRLSLLVVVGLLSSCNQSMLDEPFFRLEDGVSSTITVEASSSKREVGFETNQSKIETYSNATWLEVTQTSATSLLITTQPNLGSAKRIAEITVFAGSLERKLHVEQAGASTAVSLDEATFDYGPWEETYEISVTTISEDWSITVPDDSWVKVTAEPYLKRFFLHVAENRDFDPRTIELSLKHPGGAIPLTIKQEGALKYITPFFEWGKDFESFDNGEKARRSIFVEGPSYATQVASAQPFYIYETKARLFPFVKYEMQDLAGRFMFRTILLPANSQVVRNPEFEDFLKSEGFKLVLNDNSEAENYTKVFENQERKVTAVIVVKGDQAELIFTPIIDQPQAYPTFKSISLGFTDFYNATFDDVQAYEESIGGQYSFNWSAIYKRQSGAQIEIFLSPSPIYARGYVFSKSKLVQTIFFADRLDVGMYQYGNIYFLTKELKDLLAQEGYLLYEIDMKTSTYTYVHLEKRVALKFYYGRWNGEGVLAYNVIPIG